MNTIEEVLDRSIVFSFDRTGFERHARRFEPLEPERTLSGRRILVTGGSRGIGRAVAEAVASRGAHPVLWSRDASVGDRVAHRLQGTFTSVDLGDLGAVARAAARVEGPLAGVVLNAGSMPLSLTLTPQGHELMWASQVLGHLLLLRILRARGVLAPDARAIWVASGGMYTARLGERPPTYQRHRWYAAAKRAQVTLSQALAERWPDLWMGAMHPGWVDTEAVAHSMPWFHRLTRPILRDHAQGADTIVWLLLLAQPPRTGGFWFDRRLAPLHLLHRTRTPQEVCERMLDEVFAATDPFVTA